MRGGKRQCVIASRKALDGRWIIISAREPELAWGGGHWVARDQMRGAHLVSLPIRT
jgi:hypothetical protein